MGLIPGIGPKAGLELCRAELKRELKQSIEDFDLIYLRDENTIKFDVHRYKNEQGQIGKIRINYDGDKLKKIIEAYLQKEVTTKDVVKGAKINYALATCDIFIETENGERTVKTIKL